MTVAELLEKLKDVPLDAGVLIGRGGAFDHANAVLIIKTSTDKTEVYICDEED